VVNEDKIYDAMIAYLIVGVYQTSLHFSFTYFN